MSGIQTVITRMRLEANTAIGNESRIGGNVVCLWADELERLTQQTPSDSGRTASEANRGVQSAALYQARKEIVEAFLRANETFEQQGSNYYKGLCRGLIEASNIVVDLIEDAQP